MRKILIAGLVAATAALGTWAGVSATSSASAGIQPATPGAAFGIASHVEHGVLPATTAASTVSFTQLIDGSCIKAGECVAVGEHVTASSATALADKYGTSWSPSTVHLPSGTSVSFLAAVSCKSDGCLAVGTDVRGTTGHGLSESYNGSTWSLPSHQPAGVSGASHVVLESVSCATTVKFCVASGFYVPSSNSKLEVAIAEVWNGSTWTVSKAYAPRGTVFSNLDTISCPAANYCVLGGFYDTSSAEFTWAEKFDAKGHWTNLNSAQPAHPGFINAVSCSSTTACAAVGQDFTSSGASTGFVEMFSGAAWQLGTIAWPAGQQSNLSGVSCPTAAFCIADGGIGAYSTVAGGKAAMATWSGTGTTWTVTAAPAPGRTHGNALIGGQCLDQTDCVLTGSEGTASTNTGKGLAGALSGTTWKWQLI